MTTYNLATAMRFYTTADGCFTLRTLMFQPSPAFCNPVTSLRCGQLVCALLHTFASS